MPAEEAVGTSSRVRFLGCQPMTSQRRRHESPNGLSSWQTYPQRAGILLQENAGLG